MRDKTRSRVRYVSLIRNVRVTANSKAKVGLMSHPGGVPVHIAGCQQRKARKVGTIRTKEGLSSKHYDQDTNDLLQGSGPRLALGVAGDPVDTHRQTDRTIEVNKAHRKPRRVQRGGHSWDIVVERSKRLHRSGHLCWMDQYSTTLPVMVRGRKEKSAT